MYVKVTNPTIRNHSGVIFLDCIGCEDIYQVRVSKIALRELMDELGRFGQEHLYVDSDSIDNSLSESGRLRTRSIVVRIMTEHEASEANAVTKRMEGPHNV